MPREKTRSNIGRHTRNNRNVRSRRRKRTAEQCLQDNENARIRMAYLRTEESQELRSQRLEANKLRRRQYRQRISDANRIRHQKRMQIQQAITLSSSNDRVIKYASDTENSSYFKIIDETDTGSEHCHEFIIKSETDDMCCESENVVLPRLSPPPEPLKTFIPRVTTESKLSLVEIS